MNSTTAIPNSPARSFIPREHSEGLRRRGAQLRTIRNSEHGALVFGDLDIELLDDVRRRLAPRGRDRRAGLGIELRVEPRRELVRECRVACLVDGDPREHGAHLDVLGELTLTRREQRTESFGDLPFYSVLARELFECRFM